jgi:hypothetical protein
MELTLTNIITIIGWPISFILGIAATLITQRIQKERRIISWSLTRETDLSPRRHNAEVPTYGVPIRILVDGTEEDSLHHVEVGIGNTGNKELQNIELHLGFGEDAKVKHVKLKSDLGVWSKHIALANETKKVVIRMDHINAGQIAAIECLVADYTSGDATVDMSAPGVNLVRTAALEGLANDISLGSFGFGFMGLRYDPAARQTALLVQEVRSLAKIIAKAAMQAK